jgi:hypothetical protein
MPNIPTSIAAPPPDHFDPLATHSRLSRLTGPIDHSEDTGARPSADTAVQLAGAREEVRDEARRMRATGQLTDDERRDWLTELAFRLDALLHHLSSQGVPQSAYAALSALCTELEQITDSGNTFWDYVLRALDAFAGNAASPKKRRPFWKRTRHRS